MYRSAVLQFSQALKNIEIWLDRAEQHAAAKKFDVEVLMSSRLAPDMGAFVYQVQSACDYVKGAAAWLSGQAPPRHEDTEQTIDEVRARLRKTISFVENIPEEQFAAGSDQKVKVSWSPRGKVIQGQDYLLQVSFPNIYFHLMAAYAILRHNGVDVGKMEFLGPINWIDP